MREYLNAAEAAVPLLIGADTPVDATGWRLSYYITGVVMTYGALERFVDDTLVTAARLLNLLEPSYAALPEKVRASHLELTVLVLRSLDHPRWVGLNAADLTRRLSVCLDGVEPYELNVDVFRERQGNYRHEHVVDCCGRLGVAIPDEIGSERLRDILNGPLAGRYARPSSLLEDLVTRRNEAAHGLDVDDVLDASTLLAITDAVEQYAYGVRTSMVASLCAHLAPADGTDLGELSHAWTDVTSGVRSIGEISQRDGAGPLQVGDVVILGSGDRKRIGEVASIGWGSRRPREVAAVAGRKLALNFDRRVSEGERVLRVGKRCAEALRPYARWPT